MKFSAFASLIPDFIGRVCIAALFVNAVPGKLTDFNGTVSYISSKGIPIPFAQFLLVCTIIVLISGSIAFVFGANTILGASLLLVFLVPTTLIFHTFPVDAGLAPNLAVIGCLILAITRSRSGNIPSLRDLHRSKHNINAKRK